MIKYFLVIHLLGSTTCLNVTPGMHVQKVPYTQATQDIRREVADDATCQQIKKTLDGILKAECLKEEWR